MLGGFVDSLLQTFENCRHGLSDAALKSGNGVEAFFLELYEKEKPRLLETIRLQEQHLAEPDRRELFARVDERICKVVIPAYVRLSARFTQRERNDFYLAPEALHGVERLGWGLGGMMLGGFAVWATFIPLWEKDWILLFALLGLVFPDVRRFLTQRRYQAELNALVARTDDEIWRMDLNYLTGDLAEQASGALSGGEQDALGARLEAARPATPALRAGTKSPVKQGGR